MESGHQFGWLACWSPVTTCRPKNPPTKGRGSKMGSRPRPGPEQSGGWKVHRVHGSVWFGVVHFDLKVVCLRIGVSCKPTTIDRRTECPAPKPPALAVVSRCPVVLPRLDGRHGRCELVLNQVPGILQLRVM